MKKIEMLSSAISIIPKYDNVTNYYFYLYNNNLHFISESNSSWFYIENFIECDANIKLSYNDLKIILALGDTVKAKSIDITTVEFYTDNRKYLANVNKIDSIPDISFKVNDKLYDKPTKVLESSVAMSRISDNNIRISMTNINDHGSLILIMKNALACAFGLPSYSLDLTRYLKSFSTAMTKKFNIYIDIKKNLGYFKLDKPDINIYAGFNIVKYISHTQAENMVSGVIDESSLKDSDISFTFDINEMIESVNIMNKFEFNNYINYDITGDSNKLNINLVDAFQRSYTTDIDIEDIEGGRVKYKSFMIESSMLKFLQTTGTAKRIKVYINLNKKTVIYMPITENTEINSFILMAIKLQMYGD